MKKHITPFINQWYKDWFRNEQLYHNWAKKQNLTYNELFAVYVLHSTLGCTPTYIAEFLSISKQTVNSLMGRLEKKGYIQRIPSEEDRRSCTILLSEEGRIWASKMLGELEQLELRVFSSFTLEEIEMMVNMNKRLTDRFNEEMQKEENT